MVSTARMPMPMCTAGTVAPYARVRVPWQASAASVSTFGLGLGSFVGVTGDRNQTTEINTKAHGARRSQESST